VLRKPIHEVRERLAVPQVANLRIEFGLGSLASPDIRLSTAATPVIRRAIERGYKTLLTGGAR